MNECRVLKETMYVCLNRSYLVKRDIVCLLQLSALFVQVLLEIHTKYLNIVRDTFSNHADFISALDKACASIVNMKYENRSLSKASELVSVIV